MAALLGACLLSAYTTSFADDEASEWPPLRQGVWERASKKTLPSGKSKTSKQSRSVCHDTRVMFWGYWGSKEVGIGGCSFQSRKMSLNTYRVVARCDVRGGGESETLVTMKSVDEFESKVTTKEGGKVTRGSETGRRIGDCNLKGDSNGSP